MNNMDDNEKNAARLGCLTCPSVILLPGVGTLVKTEFKLPLIHKSSKDEEDNAEFITKSWMIPDMFQFENVGFSKTVGNFKYLVCADCEIGPIGWHCIDNKTSYIADVRVKHMES
ncbi:Guanine nucleotide exchange factor MSS4 [Daphnia magna]|uniref:Uncharacterized protein n=2 Tax=Daphnia magna TaxID=35525 RepID=A0ABR0AFP6_9CRUS|nr:hypothetical protein OUZ56_009217 [Daphnia magna]KZS20175.1 Guanine nucleotide exchange factor MSS4 [Daphnia magna]